MLKKIACFCPLFLFLFLISFCALSETPKEVVIVEETVTIDLAVSNTYTLNAYVLPEDATQSINWYSSRNSTLSVKDGVLTAHRTGVITITANIPKNEKIKDKCIVTIVDSRLPTSVTISAEKTAFEPTQTLALSVSVTPENASQDVIWESLDQRIATVDQNGVVTAKRVGSVYIRAYAKHDKDVYTQIRLTVRYIKAPTKISLPLSEHTLLIGESYQLLPELTPSDASRILHIYSSDNSIATVDESGMISALAFGKCTITVRSAADSDVSAKLALTVRDPRIPDRLIAHPSSLRLEPSNIRDISLLVLPDAENMDLVWTSNDEDIATVTPEGRVTAIAEGECTLTCHSAYSSRIFVQVPVTVQYGNKIKSFTLSVHDITIPRGEKASIIIEKTPADAGNALACEYSNPGVCEIDETGTISALRRGETTVRIYSYRDPEIYQEIKVTVEDDLSPLSVVSSESLNQVMTPGQTIKPVISFLPADAVQSYTWTCTNPEIARIDENGVITAVSPGVCKVTAVNSHVSHIFAEFNITVESDEYTLVMPARRTEKEGLSENLEKIENIRLSAQKMLKKELEAGTIAQKEYERRSKVIDEAFEMYAFPWMVESVQKYWRDIYSENGMKDFKPGIMYYGIPYISGGSAARTFNVERALADKWYIPSADGDYYIFNQNKTDYFGPYVGSDCSSFVSLAHFNSTVHDGEEVKTYTLYYDDRFITTDDPENLLAGDILVRHSIHVIMFLYWADDAHTQAVFIEQGGSEAGINTVSTSVYTVSDYMNNHYHIRTPFSR